MTTHVFVVNSKTFDIHLKYMFAGTGAGEDDVDFNGSNRTNHKHGKELKLVGMMADASRIRKGDKIIFYLQASSSEGIREGKFYGVFEAVHDNSFLEYNDCNQYLLSELEKSLTFRTLIKPCEVYPEGVTEWEALDTIKGLCSPNQMLWSLIYRKLKGNRGNTMITIYESERLCKLIRDKNSREAIATDGTSLCFDIKSQRIEICDEMFKYIGKRRDCFSILPRLTYKYKNNLAMEAHLQQYITQNIGLSTNKALDDTILNGWEIEWLGNEVGCGVGMQRIDIALSLTKGDKVLIVPIELKAVEIYDDILVQVERYIDWLEQYYVPNRICDIQPVVIARKANNRNKDKYMECIRKMKVFNEINSRRCCSIKYIEFDVSASECSIEFKHIDYLR